MSSITGTLNVTQAVTGTLPAPTDINTPNAAFASWPPFDVKQRGSSFLAYTSGGTSLFSVRDHLDITVTTEHYLDTENGDDANDGLTRGAPLATWNAAVGKGGQRITILAGSKIYRRTATSLPTADMEIIGEGTGANKPLFSADRTDGMGNWAKTAGRTNVYEATLTSGDFVSFVTDEGNLDANGNPRAYTSVGDVATVDSTPGSYYLTGAGGTIYVHEYLSAALTGDPFDGDIRCYDSLAFAPQLDNVSLYVENVDFRASIRCRNNTATGGFVAGFKDCSFYAAVMHGLDCYLDNCTVVNSGGDGVNYDTRNGIATRAVEIDCTMGETSVLGGATAQASTGHNGCTIIRMGGTYQETSGQVIADVTGCAVWMLGCTLSNSDAEVGYTGSLGDSWLDTCTITGCDTDLTADSGHTINYRNLTSGGVFTGSGTVQTY